MPYWSTSAAGKNLFALLAHIDNKSVDLDGHELCGVARLQRGRPQGVIQRG